LRGWHIRSERRFKRMCQLLRRIFPINNRINELCYLWGGLLLINEWSVGDFDGDKLSVVPFWHLLGEWCKRMFELRIGNLSIKHWPSKLFHMYCGKIHGGCGKQLYRLRDWIFSAEYWILWLLFLCKWDLCVSDRFNRVYKLRSRDVSSEHWHVKLHGMPGWDLSNNNGSIIAF
jgi:hypothetical protein